MNSLDLVLVVENLRDRVAHCENMLALAREIDVDYFRLHHFARTPKNSPNAKLLARLMTHYGYRVVSDREAA